MIAFLICCTYTSVYYVARAAQLYMAEERRERLAQRLNERHGLEGEV